MRVTKNTKVGDLDQDTRRIILAGLNLYTRNCKAAAGTLTGLRKKDDASHLTEESERVAADLAPLFDDQGDAFTDAAQGELEEAGQGS